MNKKEAAKALAKRGGDALKKKYGKDHFSKIGKMGAKKRWAKKRVEDTTPMS